MKILVTGGAGFIASHIVDGYIKGGHSVSVIDNLSTGKKENLNPKAKFYKIDIVNFSSLEKVLAKERPDIINHHAAVAEVVKSLINPLPTLEVNIAGTLNLLRLFQKYPIKKFIFASTGGAIYGDAPKLPADENALEKPLSPYGVSKLLGEKLIQAYAGAKKFSYLIFRYPNVYGPRQNPNGEAGVIAIFSQLIKNKKSPTIFGDGTKGRDYVYVSDIVQANLLALTKGNNEVINLGSDRLTTDKEVFETIATTLKSNIQCQYAPFRKGEVYRISLSKNKAKKVIEWSPKINLINGIKMTLNYL